MTDEQIKQNADEYAFALTRSDEIAEHLIHGFIAGAHSLDEEIAYLTYRLNDTAEKLQAVITERDNLRNPWISVDTVMTEKDYPEIRNNPNDIWERSEDLLVMTKEGKLEIAYFEIHRNNNPISSHGDYLLWYKRDKEYDSKVELYGNREVIKWMPIK